jgi:hypothetical protein
VKIAQGKGTRRETEGEPEPGQRPKGTNRRTPDEGNQKKADEGEGPGGQTGNRRKARRGNRRTRGEAPDHPVRVRGFGAARTYDAADTVLAGPRDLRIVVHQLSGGQRLSVRRAPRTLHFPMLSAYLSGHGSMINGNALW